MKYLGALSIILLLLLPNSVLAGEQRDGYSVQSICLAVSNNDSAKAYLLVPNKDRIPAEGFPAVLLFHDHGAYFSIGRDKVVFPIWDEKKDTCDNLSLQDASRKWTSKYYDGSFLGDSLAHNGFVVLVADALYWGSRQDSLDQIAFYQRHLETTGMAWFETTIQDDRCALDFLSNLPFVNKQRIAACGFSMGAYRAWQLTSEDQRISLCVAANWMTTLAANEGGLKNASAYSMYRPSLAKVEYAEIASKIAPRQFLLIYGANDKLFPKDAVSSAVKIIQQQYQQLLANDRFECIEVDAPHRYTKKHLEYTLRFLRKHL